MPSLEFVKNCINSPKNLKKTNFITFPFGLENKNDKSTFYVFKDLIKFSNSTLEYLLSTYENSTYQKVNRLSNDNYYNSVLQIFNIPNDMEIDCFIFKKFIQKYQTYQDMYYFNFDDFPISNKGVFSVTSKSNNNFIDKFFKGHNWLSNNYMSSTDYLNSITSYTTIYGTHPTCTSFTGYAVAYWSNNCGCYMRPTSLSYSILNLVTEESPFYYEEFSDDCTHFWNGYYLTLDSFSWSSCCLAECFGITE